MGAALLVVQEAFERIWSSLVIMCSFTPSTMVLISVSVGGTLKITFLAPFFMWFSKSVFVLNLPVASITTSTL